MKKILFKMVIMILANTTIVLAQDHKIKKDDFDRTVKQISDFLPGGWSVKPDTSHNNEMMIQSSVIDLNPDMTSNDPQVLKGQCEIYILIVPRISPDSINIIRKRNKELRNNLPPQNAKDNLANWYVQNEKTLKILDSEPTNYDNTYSYRIKCRRLPKNETDSMTYNEIMSYLNKLYIKYPD